MRRCFSRPFLCALALLMSLSRPAHAQEADLVHADAPLWAPYANNVWPQHFVDAGSFGCQHRMSLGQWRYAPAGDEGGAERWYRFDNYGVIHCWMNIAEASEPDAFGDVRPGFLVEIGRAGDVELWALQVGAKPGSDYLLLSREPGEGPIRRFHVLQRRCPRERVRAGAPLDILTTRYCGINTQAEMAALARRMAKLPALGTLTFERD